MHRTLEANATQCISNSSGISRKILACFRFQKTGPVRSRYPNRAVTLIEQSRNKTIAKSASPIKNFWLCHCNVGINTLQLSFCYCTLVPTESDLPFTVCLQNMTKSCSFMQEWMQKLRTHKLYTHSAQCWKQKIHFTINNAWSMQLTQRKYRTWCDK